MVIHKIKKVKNTYIRGINYVKGENQQIIKGS